MAGGAGTRARTQLRSKGNLGTGFRPDFPLFPAAVKCAERAKAKHVSRERHALNEKRETRTKRGNWIFVRLPERTRTMTATQLILVWIVVYVTALSSSEVGSMTAQSPFYRESFGDTR